MCFGCIVHFFDNVPALEGGTYLVTGFTDSPLGNGVGIPRGGFDFWAMNIDSSGRSIWGKRYGGSKDEELFGTAVLHEEGILLVGLTASGDGDVKGSAGKSQAAWAVCIDISGRILWEYAGVMAGDEYFNTATVDPADNCCMLAGVCNVKGKTAVGLAVKLPP